MYMYSIISYYVILYDIIDAAVALSAMPTGPVESVATIALSSQLEPGFSSGL